MSAGSTDDRQMAGIREGVGPSLSAGHSTTLVMQKGDNGSGVGQNSAMTASTDSDCKVSRANTMPARRLSKAGNANGAAKGAATGGCSLNPPATNPRQLVSTVTDVHQVESEIEAGGAINRRTDVSEACSSSHGCGGDGSSETAADGDRSSNGTASTQRMEDSTASLCTQTSKHIFSNPFQDKGNLFRLFNNIWLNIN